MLVQQRRASARDLPTAANQPGCQRLGKQEPATRSRLPRTSGGLGRKPSFDVATPRRLIASVALLLARGCTLAQCRSADGRAEAPSWVRAAPRSASPTTCSSPRRRGNNSWSSRTMVVALPGRDNRLECTVPILIQGVDQGARVGGRPLTSDCAHRTTLCHLHARLLLICLFDRCCCCCARVMQAGLRLLYETRSGCHVRAGPTASRRLFGLPRGAGRPL